MSKPKLMMLVGLPASGKSTMSKQLQEIHNAVAHSSDKIREEISGDRANQSINQEVFELLHKRVKEDLKAGKNVVYDACNINWKRRKSFLSELKVDCEKVCIFLATPHKDCVELNNSREKPIPTDVITRMYKNFYIPQSYEGWDLIQTVWNYDENKYDLSRLMEELCNFEQDNIYHDLSVGAHCIDCAVRVGGRNPTLERAALLHDIGKPFTKKFEDSKGNTTEMAHYYQHHLVSAYDSLFYPSPSLVNSIDTMEVAAYITWHMHVYFLKEEKSIDKFVKIVGQEFWDDLLLLNAADKLAKKRRGQSEL